MPIEGTQPNGHAPGTVVIAELAANPGNHALGWRRFRLGQLWKSRRLNGMRYTECWWHVGERAAH
eukprot:345407-Pleurochrysis_carterae.AAC.2